MKKIWTFGPKNLHETPLDTAIFLHRIIPKMSQLMISSGSNYLKKVVLLFFSDAAWPFIMRKKCLLTPVFCRKSHNFSKKNKESFIDVSCLTCSAKLYRSKLGSFYNWNTLNKFWDFSFFFLKLFRRGIERKYENFVWSCVSNWLRHANSTPLGKQ